MVLKAAVRKVETAATRKLIISPLAPSIKPATATAARAAMAATAATAARVATILELEYQCKCNQLGGNGGNGGDWR